MLKLKKKTGKPNNLKTNENVTCYILMFYTYNYVLSKEYCLLSRNNIFILVPDINLNEKFKPRYFMIYVVRNELGISSFPAYTAVYNK